jgi:hypothetical protein
MSPQSHPFVRLEDHPSVPTCLPRGAARSGGQGSPQAVRVFLHPHRGAHEVRPSGAGRDLQAAPVPFDGVVVADLASSWMQSTGTLCGVVRELRLGPAPSAACVIAQHWYIPLTISVSRQTF